jgi:hypothetical protein
MGAVNPATENLLNEHQAAQRLGLSVASLRRRRLLQLPPAYAKLGARVAYRPQDLDEFIAANIVRPAGGGQTAGRQ